MKEYDPTHVNTGDGVENDIRIIEVRTKSQLRKFVNLPNVMYRDVPQFVPATYGDDLSDWDKSGNPAYEYCETVCYLAYRGDEIVGRIAGIYNKKSNEKWGVHRVRFSQVDFIDDIAVSSALFGAVESWARERGCDEIHGPLGFSDLDREGMLVEGFDRESLFFTYYNHSYYIEHLSRLGYIKDVDWIEYRIKVPDPDGKQAAMLRRVSSHIKDKCELHVADVKHRSQLAPLVEQVFRLVNEAYAPLYGVYELSDAQIRRYAKKFMPMINTRYTCFIMDKNDEMVAFGVAAPSMSAALQRSHGRLFPTGWVGVLKALRKNDEINLFLIAVRPELQNAGVNAMILEKLLDGCVAGGIKYAETGPQLETNAKILSQWKSFDHEEHKRRRCFIKKL